MPPPQQPNQSDDSMSMLWGIAAIFVVCGIIWTFFKRGLVSFFFKIKLAEISLISYFTPNLEDVRTTITGTDPLAFSFQDVSQIASIVGLYLRYPVMLVILLFAVLVYFGSSTRVFKNIYTMRHLADVEKVNWPQITPVLHLDLVKADIDKGPWAMAMTPMQFCKRHNLIEERPRPLVEGMTRKERNQLEAFLKRGAASKVFVVQLGPVFHDVHQLPIHVRALFAAFAARINSDSKAALDLFAKMGASSAGKLDFSGVDALLNKYVNTKLVQEIVQAHAYVLTVMASMLEGARVDGVQASADFLWLKPVDRRLWYMLNTVGRQTPFVEVAGPFAHWVAEKENGRRLLVPFVEEATNALDIALKEIIYQPDEQS